MADDKNKAKFKIKLSPVDLSVLLYNVAEGARQPDVGFEDCTTTLRRFIAKLSPREYWVDPRLVESALWSCNMMSEADKFQSCTGETFLQFVNRVMKNSSDKIYFDRDYNQIRIKQQRGRKTEGS